MIVKKNGATKQPKAVAKLKGTMRPIRYEDTPKDSELNFLTTIPNPPARLNENGSRFWIAILSDAFNIEGYVANWDLFMFEELCYNYQLMTDAKADIEMFGNTAISPTGQRVRSIGYMIYKESLRDFSYLCLQFGLSPASRTGIKLMQHGEKKEPEQKFEL